MLSKNKNKNSKKYWTKISLLILLFLLIAFSKIPAQADDLDDIINNACKDLSKEDCEDLRKEADDKESEYDTLENQLKNTKKLADLKKQQSRTLENQLQILKLEINDVQGDIQSLETKISNTQKKIDDLEKKIKIKAQNIKENQKSLGEMVKNYYKLSKALNLSLLSNENSLTQTFNQSDYLTQISTKINNTLKIIREEKSILAQEKEANQTEKSKLNNQKSDLDKEKQNLSSKRNEKGSLLHRTKGEESNYQALISKIESQMKQLLIDVDSLSAAEQGELNDILENAKKPKYGLASTSWYYSQRDSRWKDERLGGSRYTIGDSGCAITSIAMVSTYQKDKAKPDDLSGTFFFSERKGEEGYIDWYAPPEKFDIKLVTKYGTRHNNIDWDEIDEYIEDDIPVIVFISGSGNSGHYVVVHGYDKKYKDYVVHDPYWGANLLLGTSKKLVGSLYKRTAKVDQMIVYEED